MLLLLLPPPPLPAAAAAALPSSCSCRTALSEPLLLLLLRLSQLLLEFPYHLHVDLAILQARHHGDRDVAGAHCLADVVPSLLLQTAYMHIKDTYTYRATWFLTQGIMS